VWPAGLRRQTSSCTVVAQQRDNPAVDRVRGDAVDGGRAQRPAVGDRVGLLIGELSVAVTTADRRREGQAQPGPLCPDRRVCVPGPTRTRRPGSAAGQSGPAHREHCARSRPARECRCRTNSPPRRRRRPGDRGAHGEHFEPVDAHRSRGQFDDAPLTSETIGSLAVDFDRADRRRTCAISPRNPPMAASIDSSVTSALKPDALPHLGIFGRRCLT